MQTPSFFPQVNSGALIALMTIRQQLGNDPAYLDNDAAPYDEDTKTQLKELLAVREVPVEKIVYVDKIVEKKVLVQAEASEGGGQRGPKAKGGGAQNAEVIGKEITDTLADLRSLKLNAKTLQPTDKIAIMKTQAVLLEKLITMEERNTNVKKMSMFMAMVMGILDDFVPEENRQGFMKRIQPFAEAE